GVQLDAQFGEYRRIERVVGAGSEEIVARIQQGGQADVDGFANAEGDEHAPHAGDALALGLATDRIERFFDAGRRRVAVLAVLHRLVDRFDQVGRGLEIEVDGVADVEGEDLVALLGDFVGDAGEIADGIADVVEALSGWDFTNGGGGGHLHSGFGRGGFPGHGKSLNVKGGKDYAKDGRDGLGGADFTTQSRKAFDCKDRKVRQPTTESRRLTTADQRLFSIHPIDLGLLQFIGVVDVHRLPFGVEVNGADAAFAVTVAGGLGPTERKMDF